MSSKIELKTSVEGLRELDQALGELKKSTAKNVLRRVARRALAPVEATAKARAPGSMGDTIRTSPKLNKNQAKQARQAVPKDQRAFLQMHTGSTAPHAHLIEFGTGERVQKKTGRYTGSVSPQPFIRTAWIMHKAIMLPGIADMLWTEIRKAAERAARKQARLEAKKGA